MAESKLVKVTLSEYERLGDKMKFAVWEGLTPLNHTGEAFEVPPWAGRGVEVRGNFGAGGACDIEGSLSGEHWYPLHEVDGESLLKVNESVRYVRPRVLRGDKDTKLTVMAMFRRIV